MGLYLLRYEYLIYLPIRGDLYRHFTYLYLVLKLTIIILLFYFISERERGFYVHIATNDSYMLTSPSDLL